LVGVCWFYQSDVFQAVLFRHAGVVLEEPLLDVVEFLLEFLELLLVSILNKEANRQRIEHLVASSA
jgi:hypothetical protein